MLQEILASVEAGLEDLRGARDSLRAAADAAPPARDLAAALRGPGLSVIAEIKRRSPSRGRIDAALDPAELASSYESGGASAISVLTEPAYFDGSLADLQQVRSTVAAPVLRKDFILDESQVWQARAASADSLLLIVAALDPARLVQLLQSSRSVGMEPLVEVHDEREAAIAVECGASIVGVNNRDLATFDVNLATAERLRGRLGDAVAVAESGIWTDADAARMRAAGYDAVLVGESLVRSADPAALIRSWTQGT